MKSFIHVLFPLFLFSWLSASCYGPDEIFYVRTFYIMGSEFEYKLYCKKKSTCEKTVSESQKKLKHIDYLFSNYRDDSVLFKVNQSAGKGPVEVPEEFFRLTELSINYSELTEGSFDISVGRVFELWKNSAKSNKLPEKEQIWNALKCTGYEKIVLDGKKRTVSFDSDCLELDYGAIGKGYAVDEVVKIIRSYGIKKGLINFSGNIFALDKPDDEKGWETGIKDPFNKGSVIDLIFIDNLGVATSGDYEKYFLINGKRYSHIIDPATGYPVEKLSSVTVVADSATKADALSTAFSVMGRSKTAGFVSKQKNVGVLMIEGDRSNFEVYKSEEFKTLQ